MNQGRDQGRDQGGDDDGPIPNPLQQTYDKRFAAAVVPAAVAVAVAAAVAAVAPRGGGARRKDAGGVPPANPIRCGRRSAISGVTPFCARSQAVAAARGAVVVAGAAVG